MIFHSSGLLGGGIQGGSILSILEHVFGDGSEIQQAL